MLADAGFAVELPRLPGHGTDTEDMVETGWDDWLTEAERALEALQARTTGGRVVVVGLSMGGALTAALAEGHPELAGIVLINTPVAAPAELATAMEEMLAGGVEVLDSIGGDIADPDADEASYDETPLRPLLTMIMAGQDVRARLPEIQVPDASSSPAGRTTSSTPTTPTSSPRSSAVRSSASGSRRASTSPRSTTTAPRSSPPRSPSPNASPRAEDPTARLGSLPRVGVLGRSFAPCAWEIARDGIRGPAMRSAATARRSSV